MNKILATILAGIIGLGIGYAQQPIQNKKTEKVKPETAKINLCDLLNEPEKYYGKYVSMYAIPINFYEYVSKSSIVTKYRSEYTITVLLEGNCNIVKNVPKVLEADCKYIGPNEKLKFYLQGELNNNDAGEVKIEGVLETRKEGDIFFEIKDITVLGKKFECTEYEKNE